MIDIILPTYNGEKYISQQIDSIINQTYSDWKLIIRDDGSTDNTIKIINRYIKDYPKKIILIKDNLGNLGTSGSNNILIQYVSSNYFMFCDQDDIWEYNKIEESLREMQIIERLNPNIPILICSDASCIDTNNIIINHSFFKSQKFINTTNSAHKLLALNIVQGSTALMNYNVIKTIQYIPKGIYHDWWTAVNVAYYGKISYISKPLLKYRQHNNNVVGALNIDHKYFISKIFMIDKQMKIYITMYKSLSFKPSIFKWIYYKALFTLLRLIP